MASSKKPRKLKFEPRARIIRTIGDKLISGPVAAVIEIVKNSHDADAESVRIVFMPPGEDHNGLIVVEDDGHGMTLSDIQDKWMEPATSDKVQRRKTAGGRTMLGSKGIGRFAAAKLGRYLTLESIAEVGRGQMESTKVGPIDWEVFESPKYLSEIEFDYENESSPGPTGTKLTIADMREVWTRTRLRELTLELRKMISPIDETDEAGFKIYLDLTAFSEENSGFSGSEIVNDPFAAAEELNRILPLPLLKSCDYEVEGSFNEDGKFEGSMTIHRGGLRPEGIDFSLPLDAELGEISCGIVLVHLFIFDRESDALARSMERAGMGKMSARAARAIVDEVSGVAIYRDGFRIRPYGDPDNDWLTLDKHRVNNPTTKIGHNQVSGILVIDGEENSGLIEKSSREGLEESGSFFRLKRLMEQLLAEVVEPRRYNFRNDADISRANRPNFKQAYSSAELRWARSIVARLPERDRPNAEKVVAEQSSRLKTLIRSLEEKQEVLEQQVTLGLILGEVLHEGQSPVAYVQDESGRLSRWWPTLFSDSNETEKRKAEVPSILRRMSESAERLTDLFRTIRPLAGAKRGRPLYYNPNQVVIDMIGLYRSRLEEAGIKTDHRSPSEVNDMLGYRSDLATALTNLIDNSIYWLDHHKIKSPLISIEVTQDRKDCVIDFIDNGRGIPDEFQNSVFDVGFTLKPRGTGLGLSIANEALSRSDGTLEYVPGAPGAHFRMRLPRGE